jgi:hypothetical protein
MPPSGTLTERPARCRTCDKPLSQPHTGRPRIYCGDRCRKLNAARRCLDCGTIINTDGRRTNPSLLCTPCRGRYQREQSRAWILRSITDWVTLFGHPPGAPDWNPTHARRTGMAWKADRYAQTGRKWPSTTLCQDVFGSWNDALAAAGYPPVAPGEYRDGRTIRDIPRHGHAAHYWTPERCVDAGVRWAREHGQPPTSTSWRPAQSGYPHINTIADRFGTWRAYRTILDQELATDAR